MNEPKPSAAAVHQDDLNELERMAQAIGRAEALAAEWKQTAENYRLELHVANDDIGRLEDTRRKYIGMVDALESKLEEAQREAEHQQTGAEAEVVKLRDALAAAQALALANGLRADAQAARAQNLQAACGVLRADLDAADARAEAAERKALLQAYAPALVREVEALRAAIERVRAIRDDLSDNFEDVHADVVVAMLDRALEARCD